jgi:PAS domain S-box-containing protein
MGGMWLNLNKLHIKIIILLTSVLALLLGTDYFLSRKLFETEYSKAIFSEVKAVGRSLELQLDKLLNQYELDIEDLMGFNIILEEIVEKYGDVSYAYLTNSNGHILFHNDMSYSETNVEVQDVYYLIRDQVEGFTSYKVDDIEYYAFVLPVYGKDRYEGALVLGIPYHIISNRIFVVTGYTAIISFIIFLICLFILLCIFTVWISKPLIKLDKATKQIAAEGTDSFKGVDIKSKDEIGRLAQSFNIMAYELEKSTVSKKYMNDIITSMSDALIVIDSQRKIQTVNQAACDLFEYEAEELLEQSIQMLSPLEDGNFPKDVTHLFMEQGEIKNFETVYKTKSGSRVPILVSCSIMKDGKENIKYIVITIKDITQIKEASEALALQAQQLARSNAQLQEFAYIASHDLQEPLRKVITFSQRLSDKYKEDLDEKGQEYLNRMINSSKRMQKLIQDLLEYSKISIKEEEYTLVDLQSICSEVISDLEVRIERTQAKIEIVNKLPMIEAEETQIRQLFQNVIGNALKFRKENVLPYIKIHCKVIEYQTVKICELAFEDNGIGIDPKYFDRVFGVFQRLNGRNNYEGTGVGLAICKKIVERHKGEIEIKSKVGNGTIFMIKLPFKQ